MSAICHVGLSVPDLERAARWYQEVLGFDQLAGETEVRPGEGHAARMAADVLGAGFGALRQRHLTGVNGVAVELFEFESPPYELRGLFHVCVTVDDVPATARRVAATGGRQTSRVWQIFEHEPFRMCYCRDPFGNIIELYSHSHERVYANRRGET
jgi:catechol 2,3-dioxygenase-like lactoylglutathione lyase family enzyme